MAFWQQSQGTVPRSQTRRRTCQLHYEFAWLENTLIHEAFCQSHKLFFKQEWQNLHPCNFSLKYCAAINGKSILLSSLFIRYDQSSHDKSCGGKREINVCARTTYRSKISAKEHSLRNTGWSRIFRL